MSRQRKSYTLKFKRKVIFLFEQCGNKSLVARENNISSEIVTRWVQNKAKIMNSVRCNKDTRKIRIISISVQKLNCLNPEAEARIYNWFLSQREKKIGVSRLSILNKMLKDQEENQPANSVKVSLSWLQRLMKRNQLSLRRISGSGRSFPSNSKEKITNYLLELHTIVKNNKFKAFEVFGFDETCFRLDSPSNLTVSEIGVRKTYSKSTGKEKAK